MNGCSYHVQAAAGGAEPGVLTLRAYSQRPHAAITAPPGLMARKPADGIGLEHTLNSAPQNNPSLHPSTHPSM